MKHFALEIGPEQQQGSRVKRSLCCPEALVRTPAPDVRTLYELFVNSAKKYGKKDGFGTRNVDKVIDEGRVVQVTEKGRQVSRRKTKRYMKLSKFYYTTYEDALRLVHALGAGLIKLGIKEKSKIVLYSPTSFDWMLMAHCCFSQNMTIVTANETMNGSDLLCCLNETEAVAIYTTDELLTDVSKVAAQCRKLKYVLYSGDIVPGIVTSLREATSQRILSLNSLCKLGDENPVEQKKPEPEDLCCIMYTSGSTGQPKGVMLSHRNIIASIAGINAILGHLITDQDSMMAYLPLSHVFEFVVENLCIFWGVVLGYGSVETLEDASVRRCKGDIQEFKPTLMTGTPLIWESIRKRVFDKVSKSSSVAQKDFQRAFIIKAWLLKYHMSTTFIDKLIFNKFRKAVGGKLRLALSGGAALSAETQKFLSVTLCPILTGFGMTESSGVCCLMTPNQFGLGHVGSLVPCCEIKLVNVHELRYFSTNLKPQGEVWIRGPSVTKGYWKKDDLTKEAITEDNWFRTGDIAEWNANGTLTVIDRIKDFVKLSSSRYIALEKLNSVYKGCVYVDHVCVYANSLAHKPVALAALSQLAVRRLAITKDVVEPEWKLLCDNPVIKKAIFDELLNQAKKGRLRNAEVISDVHLCPELWAVETGMLTASGKLKRSQIVKTYKNELDDMIAKQKTMF